MRNLAIGLVMLTTAACSLQQSHRDDTVIYGEGSAVGVRGTLVRCESSNNGRETCRVDARDRMVAVNQQLSDKPCILGRSWGISNDRDEIWVDNGCRAEFQVGGTAVATTAFGRSVVCESQNNGKASCPVDTSYGVQLVRQISESECVRGSGWGFDENGIWVDRGCRAEFVLGGDQRYAPRATPARAVVVCESQDNAMNRCPADTYYGVALARQISDSVCVRGVTWGYDASGIWVTGGCRAQFVVN